MNNDLQAALSALTTVESQLDNLVSAEHITVAQRLKEVNDKLYRKANDLKEGGLNVDSQLEQSDRINAKLTQFLNKFA